MPPLPSSSRRSGDPSGTDSRGTARVGRPVALLLVLVAAACGGEEKAETGPDAGKPTYGDNLASAYRQGMATGAHADLELISTAVMQYVTNVGDLPQARDIDGLAALLEPTHLRLVPRADPWGTPYRWSSSSTSYTIASAGKDGVFGTDDDLELADGQITKMPKAFTRMQ